MIKSGCNIKEEFGCEFITMIENGSMLKIQNKVMCVMNKNVINNAQFKKIALEILIDFDNLCRKNNIKYSLAYGTLIGAIRHKGYIPWDDDIDVIMLREEYEKFLKVKEELKNEHTFISIETNSLYSASLAKIYNNNTVLTETMHRDLCDIGVYIDVFVFDYVPESTMRRKCLYYQALFCRKSWAFSTYYPKTKLGVERKLRDVAAKWQLGRRANIWLNKKLKKQPKSQLVCAMLFVYNWDWETFNTDEFNNLTEIEFENHSFLCFEHYDMFLKRWYGDYMKLPPEKERVVGHSYNVYYKE